MSADHAARMARIIGDDPERLRILRQVRALALPDCWIAAGFLRNAVWDYLHGRPSQQAYEDVDVIWFDTGRASAAEDVAIERQLTRRDAATCWSVKNQARMHRRNGDPPYRGSGDAMCHWAETAAAVAVRLDSDDRLDFLAPLGTDDLFRMILRPGPRFFGDKRAVFDARVAGKRWLEHWPRLRLAAAAPAPETSQRLSDAAHAP